MIEATANGRVDGAWQLAVACLGTLATYLWGGWDTVITALLVLTCIDYATGVVAAAIRGELDSGIGAQGIARKIGMFVVVAAANVLDNTGGIGEPIMRTIACWWYCANEGLSILENAGEIGVPIPERLRAAIARLRDEGGDHDVGGS